MSSETIATSATVLSEMSKETETLYKAIISNTTDAQLIWKTQFILKEFDLLTVGLMKNTSVKGLHLLGNILGPQGCHLVSNIFRQNRTIVSFTLFGNDAGDASAFQIFRHLGNNVSLRSLRLGDNSCGLSSWRALADGLQSSQCSLESISITNEILFDDESCQIVVQALAKNHPKIEKIDFSCCNVGDIGAASFAPLLDTSNHLQELNLSTNDISDIAMAPLLEALSSSTSLCSIWLYCNRFTQRGGDTLLQWLKDHRSRLTGLNLIGLTGNSMTVDLLNDIDAALLLRTKSRVLENGRQQ